MLLLFFCHRELRCYTEVTNWKNSQMGNNNAYCQDNEIGWIDWKKGRSSASLPGL